MLLLLNIFSLLVDMKSSIKIGGKEAAESRGLHVNQSIPTKTLSPSKKRKKKGVLQYDYCKK